MNFTFTNQFQMWIRGQKSQNGSPRLTSLPFLAIVRRGGNCLLLPAATNVVAVCTDEVRLIPGIHFEVGLEEVLQKTVSLALRVFFAGVNKMLGSGDPGGGGRGGGGRDLDLNYSLDCQGDGGSHAHKWENGPKFYK